MSTNDATDASGAVANTSDGEQKLGVHRNVSVNRFQVLKLNLDSNDLPASSSSSAAVNAASKGKMQKAASEPPLSLSVLSAAGRQSSAIDRFEV
ncbi:unnamed protein product [Litomosoides sigmodontis]|uniref:Uncharacterized protein n=1 Tax=Litomosoides sigmodontis TaxID=42156 RepID=A0A3P6VH38_LITSI|nr:unnamed protein product [Litomosoides sigmodontis]VDM91937.1 unnamed protein product [Litomosoides sigmodontis]